MTVPQTTGIGGYVERVALPFADLWVNEEGKSVPGAQPNPAASILAWSFSAIQPGDTIMGMVVLAGVEEVS